MKAVHRYVHLTEGHRTTIKSLLDFSLQPAAPPSLQVSVRQTEGLTTSLLDLEELGWRALKQVSTISRPPPRPRAYPEHAPPS